MDWQFYLFSTLIIAALFWLWGWAHGFDSDSDSNNVWNRFSERDIDSWRSDGGSSPADRDDASPGGGE
jgi:hypothetical protein